MNAIVNVSKSWGIGKNGDLLFHIKEDMDYFKDKTTGKVIIYGRRTLDTFPDKLPLRERINIVVTRDKNRLSDNARNKCILIDEIDDKYGLSSCDKLFDLLNRYEALNERLLFVAGSTQKAIALADILSGKNPNNVFVCGGEATYEKFLPYCNKVYVTKTCFEKKADSFFPNLDNSDEWDLVDLFTFKDSNHISICKFCTYERIKNIKE